MLNPIIVLRGKTLRKVQDTMRPGMIIIASLLIALAIFSCETEAQWVRADSGLTYSAGTYVRAFCAAGTDLFAGTDPGGVFRSTDYGASWTVASGDRTLLDVKSLIAKGADLFAGTHGDVLRTTNCGASWFSVLKKPDVYALLVNGTHLFAGTDVGVFLSNDDGASWTSKSNGLTYPAVNALAYIGANLFAAANDGEVFRSTNDGASWTAVNAGLPGSIIWALAVCGTNLFAGTWDNGVYRSTNNGTSWTAVNAGLTRGAAWIPSVWAFAVSGTNLFAGTINAGVFLSTNNGTTWRAVNSGLTTNTIVSLGVVGEYLVAGTGNGGGIFRRSIPEILRSGEIPTDGLVAYYPFTGNANDPSGYANHGIVYGATLTSDRFGNPQSAYRFDGVAQYIRVPNAPDLQSVAQKSVSFWINMEPGGGPQNPRILSKGYPGGFEIGTAGTEESRNLIFTQPGVNFASKGKVSSGSWQHCVWTYDGTTSSVYINGVRDTTGAFIPASVTTDLYIGRASTLNTADNFKGSIDDIRVYNRALSPAEVVLLYGEAGWNRDPNTDLVAYYPFSGSAVDGSGNGNHGVVNGATLTVDRFGNPQSAYHFDGVTQYIRVPNSSGLQNVAQKTVSFWMNFEPGGGTQNPRVISKGYSGGFEIGTSGTDTSRYMNFTQPGLNFVSKRKVPAGSWHHCVWTYNGFSSSVYLDNARDTTGVFTPTSVTTDLFIGRASTLNAVDNFKGSIDDIRVYNRAVSPSEVSTLFGEGGWNGESIERPVAYYPFSGNACDSSGYGNDGAVNGATLTADRFGNPQSAYHFDGVTQYVRIPNSTRLQSVSYKSISLWLQMEPGGGPQNPRIISKGYLGGFEIGTDGTGASRNIVLIQPGVNFVSKGKLSSGSWHHLVWTYNGSTSSVYFDNVRDTTGAFVPTAVATDLYVGRASNLNVADNFKGSIDEIRIYNRALSPLEVGQLYAEQPVPIRLATFTATRVSPSQVRLEWTTISEISNYGFEIQKKVTPQAGYQTLINSFVPGHGTTNEPHHYSFVDPATTGGECVYRLKQMDLDGSVRYSDGIRVGLLNSVGEKDIPAVFSLSQNYPNPFNPATNIRFGLPFRSHVTLTLFNTLGQTVQTLVNGEMAAGYHEVRFDGSNLASGVYLYRIQAAGFVQIRKLMILK
jgi:photosystem II stability/assembly factor-like uncharacterized protein